MKKIFQLNPEEELRLKERTRNLAQVPDSDDLSADFFPVVEFVMKQEHYAIKNEHIRSIIAADQLCSLPCTPEHILGVVNFQGQIIAVNDLCILFGLKGPRDLKTSSILILSNQTVDIGLIVDEVLTSKQVCKTSFKTSLAHLTGIGKEYISAVSAEGLALLDAVSILSDKHLIVNEQY